MSVSILLAAVIGLLVGAIAAYLVARARAESAASTAVADLRVAEAAARAETAAASRRAGELETTIDRLRADAVATQQELSALRTDNTRLRAEAASFDTRLEEMRLAQQRLTDTFQALSGEALRQNNESFLQLAKQELDRVREATATDTTQKHQAIDALLLPVREGLAAYQAKLLEIETQRTDSFATLAERLESVAKASESLRGETATLGRALRSANTRGSWGEVQLRRVCELAGMIDHCDFQTQATVTSEDGRLRPDMIVNLPGGTTIVVDSKAPLTAFLEAVATDDDSRRRELFGQHAVHVRRHVEALSRKSYSEQFAQAPEFVVLFLPSEALFSAALEHDPALIEQGVTQGVIIATPTTLIALLKAVAMGWRHERIAETAQEVSALGRQLYERLCTLGEHFDELGRHLGKAVGSYNKGIASLEKRVLVTARKFQALGAGGEKELDDPGTIEIVPTMLQADELRLLPSAPALEQ